MRLALGLAAALWLTALQPALAQNRPTPKRAEPSARAPHKAGAADQPALSPTEKEAAESRARNEAKQRAWDEKMKRTMRGICSGAQGC